MRWTLSGGVNRAALLIAGLTAFHLAAAPAGALVRVDRATGQKFGILPPPPPSSGVTSPTADPFSSGPITPTCDTLVDAQCHSRLTNPARGPVQHHEREYLFFWGSGSAFPTGYEYEVRRWLDDLVAGDYRSGHPAGHDVGNPVSIVQQYYDFSGPHGSKNFIPLDIQDGGTITDHDPLPPNHCTDSFDGSHGTYTFPRCLTAQQIQAEVWHWVLAHHLPSGLGVEYFVLTPPGVGTCNDSGPGDCEITSYCAEHSLIPTVHGQILYALLPWLPGTLCDTSQLGITPVYSSAVDNAVGVFSHELSETMTDPELDAWQGAGGGSDEVGDKCAYYYAQGRDYLDFTGLPRTSAGAYYNATLRADHYLIQTEFDNRFRGCGQWDAEPPPVASLSLPSPASAGGPATFGLRRVADPAGIAYVRWGFGDGQSVRSLGLKTVHHTYPRAGTYVIQVIVTDGHGNELRRTATLRVRRPT